MIHLQTEITTPLVLNIGDNVFYLLQESFLCVFVEQGLMILKGQQGGQVVKPQKSDKKVSLTVR